MSVVGNILYCPNPSCAHQQPDVNRAYCEICGTSLGAPNVNIVSTELERLALDTRYDESKGYLISIGLATVLDDFEQFFNSNAKAVINMNLDLLYKWAGQDSNYYAYGRGVEDGLRPIASLFNDRKRTAIDACLYGTYGREIVYAALSLNDHGLESYGDCTVILNENAISLRASVLEENAFDFVKTHDINLATLVIPLGYRATWDGKLKLTVAKIYKKLNLKSQIKDFAKFVLLNSKRRENDEFVEVHIYKELSPRSVSTIFIPTPINDTDKYFVEGIRQKSTSKIVLN